MRLLKGKERKEKVREEKKGRERERKRSSEDLDSVVSRVTDDDVVVLIYCYSLKIVELTRT